MSVLLAWRDYLHTGDQRLLAEVYDTCVARNLDASLNAAGLVAKEPGSSSQTNADLVDWPTSNRDGYVFTTVNTVINSWLFAAYATLAAVAGVLGKASDATVYADRAAGLRAAINRDLLDRSAGRYLDGAGTTHTAQHATAFPVALGVAEDADLGALAEWLVSGGNRISVYGAQFLLDALYRCGRGDAGYAMLTSRDQASWLHMIDDLGATICMEAWDPALKSNTTFSHAWATAPANVVAEHLAGIRIVEAGARMIEVAPQPGTLQRFTATVPTVRGSVRVALDRDRAATCLLEIELSPNCTGRIVLDQATLGLPALDPATTGRVLVCSAGGDPDGAVDGGRLLPTGVAPGVTRISVPT